MAVVLGVLLCAACSGGGPPTPLPDTWAAIGPDYSPGHVSTIDLRADGTGTFTHVPVWSGRGPCTDENTRPFTGEITWTTHDERFTVDAGGHPRDPVG
jgi:hypothetical protein